MIELDFIVLYQDLSFHLKIVFLGSGISDYTFFVSVALILPIYSLIWLVDHVTLDIPLSYRSK